MAILNAIRGTEEANREKEGKYDLQLPICPAKLWYGKYGENAWRYSDDVDPYRYYRDNEVELEISVVDKDGERVGWWYLYPVEGLLKSYTGSWLVPIDEEGNFKIYRNKEVARRAILSLAGRLKRDHGSYPLVEAVRLDGDSFGSVEHESKPRLYSFLFDEQTKEPSIESVSLVH